MSWIALAVLTAFFYGVYNFFIKIASGSIHQIVGAVILQVVAALVGGGRPIVSQCHSCIPSPIR